ncbi:glycine zipper 2TM domain-containing protein [Litorivicinus lipolyticus]|uniref:Glycine zipper 2TM domain-containing protein n=1 Tax=Litorivicinus lipolyticus TaxID=418701 RepID=A0A5Q2QCC4_9GAMM|nr:glycine zipper 2TM domain-containing protein [Litorivicinus lipolyticus]QGG79480.1 glycine zipper 2TM domain-containing protein [Litorivicinus lipolyticus]
MAHIIKVLLAVSTLVLAGCASSLKGDVYSRGEARDVATVQYGTINEVRAVIIEGTQSGAGAVAGGAIGGIAGSGVSSGSRESRIGAILVGAVGALVGNKAEEALTKTQGLEMVVSLDAGRVISLVQEVSRVDEFAPGQRVKVIGTGKNTRVSPAAD